MILGVSTYNESSDVFSLGLVFAEFYNLIPLFWGTSSLNQLQKYMINLGTHDFIYWAEGLEQINKINYRFPKNTSWNLAKLLPGASTTAIDWITQMLNINPERRPTISEILNHSFFNEPTRQPFKPWFESKRKSMDQIKEEITKSIVNRSMPDLKMNITGCTLPSVDSQEDIKPRRKLPKLKIKLK